MTSKEVSRPDIDWDNPDTFTLRDALLCDVGHMALQFGLSEETAKTLSELANAGMSLTPDADKLGKVEGGPIKSLELLLALLVQYAVELGNPNAVVTTPTIH